MEEANVDVASSELSVGINKRALDQLPHRILKQFDRISERGGRRKRVRFNIDETSLRHLKTNADSRLSHPNLVSDKGESVFEIGECKSVRRVCVVLVERSLVLTDVKRIAHDLDPLRVPAASDLSYYRQMLSSEIVWVDSYAAHDKIGVAVRHREVVYLLNIVSESLT